MRVKKATATTNNGTVTPTGVATTEFNVDQIPSVANGNGHVSPGPVRTTIVLPEYLYWTLSAWCARERLRKGDGIVELLKAGLTAKGLQPDKTPKKITIVY